MLLDKVVILTGKYKGMSMWVRGLTREGMLLVGSNDQDEPFEIHPQDCELADRPDLIRKQLK